MMDDDRAFIPARGIAHPAPIPITFQLSRCTQIPEKRLFVINLFPGFQCRFIALKARNVALKARTKFG
jgi:hypothetical protein